MCAPPRSRIVFLNKEAFGEKISEADAELHVAEAMRSMGFVTAYTKEQLANGEVAPSPIGRMFANSYSPYGGWWVMGYPPPFSLSRKEGTDHGVAYSYDQHVPLAFYGPAFKPGIYRDQVEPIDLAPTLAVRLGINKPTNSTGHVLTQALSTKSDVPAPSARCASSRHTGGAAVTPAPKSPLDMSVSVAGIELKNPVLAASGTFGYGVEFEDVVTLDRLGGFVTKVCPASLCPAIRLRACLRRPPAC